MYNLRNIFRDINLFKNYINYMILCYIFILILNVVLCGIIVLNGYTDKHIYLSLVIIISNIINVIYYIFLRYNISGIFSKRHDTITISNYLFKIKTFTYIDFFINSFAFINLTILFSIWIGKKSDLDKDILVFEYCLNITINLISIFICILTITKIKMIFNPENYQIRGIINDQIDNPINDI